MIYKSSSRLLAIKFLGLWGAGQVPPAKDGKELETQSSTGNAHNEVEPPQYHKKQPPIKNYDDAKADSSRKVMGLMLEKGIPGLVVCVSKRGQIVWHSAFGYCDVENQLECRPEARMRIASVSKPLFVSTVIGPLMDTQEVDLKSSIHDYLPEKEFPKKKYDGKDVDITIENLLAHTSGVRSYDDSAGSLKPIGSSGSEKIYQCDDQFNKVEYYQRKTYRNVIDALEPFRESPLVSEPGQKYNYTSYGYCLLSAVIEKVYQQKDEHKGTEDKPFQIEDYWMKILRRDWKMDETNLDQDELVLPNRARYYLRSGLNGKLINAPYTDNSNKWAGGGIVSSAKDLVKFGNALIESYKGKEGALLRRETIDEMWRKRSPYYALGYHIHDLNPDESGGEKVAVNHLGNAVGASSAFIIYPESEIVVVILANLGRVNLRALGLFIADQFVQAR